MLVHLLLPKFIFHLLPRLNQKLTFWTSWSGVGKLLSYILWTKSKQKVPFGKVCLAYSDFASVQIVYITKNVEKRQKTGFLQVEYSLVAFWTRWCGLGIVLDWILSTKTKQKVAISKVCFAYRSFEEGKIFKIAKNDEKRRFGTMNRALQHFERVDLS